jgi:outer membrane protein assembly factor BamE
MFRPLIALAFAAPLAACGSVPRIPGITPYKIDIQQGNFVSQEMVSQIKSGMSKEQVRLALGTPLLTDLFHADRWDYVYWREAPDGKRESRKLTVYFADGKLERVDGDVAPAKEQAAKEQPAKEAK